MVNGKGRLIRRFKDHRCAPASLNVHLASLSRRQHRFESGRGRHQKAALITKTFRPVTRPDAVRIGELAHANGCRRALTRLLAARGKGCRFIAQLRNVRSLHHRIPKIGQSLQGSRAGLGRSQRVIGTPLTRNTARTPAHCPQQASDGRARWRKPGETDLKRRGIIPAQARRLG